MAKRSAKKSAQKPEKVTATEALERLLGHTFARPELLALAMTHRSFVYDTPGTTVAEDRADPSRDNEQLEFMGDAALGLLAAEALCRRFPASREGELTRLRSSVVSRRHLGEVGTRLGLGRWLKLGPTAERDSARSNPALFANAVEALIAALYLDGGLPAARRFVEQEVLAGLGEGSSAQDAGRDFKTSLKEMLEAEGKPGPQYRLLEETGPAHRRVFRMQVILGTGEAVAEAEGVSKKAAQQEAARLAIERLRTVP